MVDFITPLYQSEGSPAYSTVKWSAVMTLFFGEVAIVLTLPPVEGRARLDNTIVNAVLYRSNTRPGQPDNSQYLSRRSEDYSLGASLGKGASRSRCLSRLCYFLSLHMVYELRFHHGKFSFLIQT